MYTYEIGSIFIGLTHFEEREYLKNHHLHFIFIFAMLGIVILLALMFSGISSFTFLLIMCRYIPLISAVLAVLQRKNLCTFQCYLFRCYLYFDST
jgi:uncharacterized membrane protein